MQYSAIISASLLTLVAAVPPASYAPASTDAAPIYDNPTDCAYEAKIDGDIKATFHFSAGDYGKGVEVVVDVETCGEHVPPFGYHIHDQPIKDGDCATALAHLDPYKRGQETPCDATKPQTCEVGDLSGKHGKIDKAKGYHKEYLELYASIKPGIGAFLGNRSIVIHAGDEKKTRIACANIYKVEDYKPDYPSEDESPVYPGEESDEECEDEEETPYPPHGTGSPYPPPTGGKPYPHGPKDETSPEAPKTPSTYPPSTGPAAPAYPSKPGNATSGKPPAVYTGSAATFGVSSALAFVAVLAFAL